MLQQTDKLIMTVPEVKRVFGKMGRAETATDPAPLTMIETTIQLKPREQWREGMTLEKLKQELDSRVQLPGLTNAWVMPIKTRIDMLATGIKTPVGIKVAGPDLEEIESIGKRIEEVLNKVPGTVSVYSERVAGGRYVIVDIDRIAASRFALNIADVQEVVRTAVGGMRVAQTVEGLERYPINMRYPRDVRDSLEKLRNLPIVTPRVRASRSPRLPTSVSMTVPASSRPKMPGSTAGSMSISRGATSAAMSPRRRKSSEQVELPAGYSIAWSGQYEYMVRARNAGYVVPVTLAIIVLLLYLNFRRFAEVADHHGHPATGADRWLLAAVPAGLQPVGGGRRRLHRAGRRRRRDRRDHAGLSEPGAATPDRVPAEGRALTTADMRKAVIDGALLRVRPIMMTVAAIIAGLMPIMLGSGTGSEVMRRIAAPMVGGMASATLLTLVVIPAVFLIWKLRGVKD